LLQWVPLLMVNKYCKFQMDTFDSFWEMDSWQKTLPTQSLTPEWRQ
jgi:hypothetical protein